MEKTLSTNEIKYWILNNLNITGTGYKKKTIHLYKNALSTVRVIITVKVQRYKKPA